MIAERGSALVLTLCVCLTSALLCVLLAVMVAAGQEGLAAEQRGRDLLQEADNALGLLASKAAKDWRTAEVELPQGVGTLEAVDTSGEWILNAKVQITVGEATRLLEAQVERGRDGLDLPTAALVAENVILLAGRSLPWLVQNQDAQVPVVHLVALPSSGQGWCTAGLSDAIPLAPGRGLAIAVGGLLRGSCYGVGGPYGGNPRHQNHTQRWCGRSNAGATGPSRPDGGRRS